jgi:hypothetical protein
MRRCKFLETDSVGGIRHEYCNNQEMLKINKQDNGKIRCMGKRCGNACFEDAEGQNERK